LNLSRAVFAHELHVSPRTLEKWEQDRTKPKEQAATLIMLILFHSLEKARHHSRKVIISGVVTWKF
jgi:DNA-binding transcriptional regulator YiaG